MNSVLLAAAAKSLQSCPTLCDPMDCSPPGPQFRQEYWSELPFPSPGDLPDLGIEPQSPALPADSLPAELSGKPTDPNVIHLKETLKFVSRLSRCLP